MAVFPGLWYNKIPLPSTVFRRKCKGERLIVDSQLIQSCLNNEEYGDAQLMAACFKDEILFDVDEQEWYVWDSRWKLDKANQVYNLASIGLAKVYRKEAKNQPKDIATLFNKRAKKLLNRNRLSNVVSIAEKQPDLMLENVQWDADPWSLACKNGVVSLKDGEIREAVQQDYIRTVIPTKYDHLQTKCPIFDSFLKDVFDEDNKFIANKTIKFMQRLLGYGVTGLSVEHILPILYGRKGRNGKDTLLNALIQVLGEVISGPVGQEILLSGSKSPNAATPYTWALRSKRIAFVSETNENVNLDSGQAKLLTGGGMLTGRLLNQNPITFSPQHLLCLITNFKPRAPINDHALWNRIILINFGISFVNHPKEPWEKRRDKELHYKLIEDAPGILSWLIRGAIDWNRYGLSIPNHIEAATGMYRETEDNFSEFIDMFETRRGEVGLKPREVYAEYTNWCDNERRKALGANRFYGVFSEYFPRTKTNKGFMFKQLCLKPEVMQPVNGVMELIESQ